MAKKKLTAEDLCNGVDASMKEQALTLARAILAMQEKIEENLEEYSNMQLCQTVKVNTGETVCRQNPSLIEFRATVKDYGANLKTLQSMIDAGKAPTSASNIEQLKQKFKMVK